MSENSFLISRINDMTNQPLLHFRILVSCAVALWDVKKEQLSACATCRSGLFFNLDAALFLCSSREVGDVRKRVHVTR